MHYHETYLLCSKFTDEAQLNVTPSFNLFSAEASSLVGIIMLLKKVWKLIAVLHRIDPLALKPRFGVLHPLKEELLHAKHNNPTDRIRHRETSQFRSKFGDTARGVLLESSKGVGQWGAFFYRRFSGDCKIFESTPSFEVTLYTPED